MTPKFGINSPQTVKHISQKAFFKHALVILVTFTKNSRERGLAYLAASLEEWLEALSILQDNQGRSQAAPLAASRQRTRCRDRTQPQRTSRILRASYHSGTDAARYANPFSRRPFLQKFTKAIQIKYVDVARHPFFHRKNENQLKSPPKKIIIIHICIGFRLNNKGGCSMIHSKTEQEGFLWEHF